MNLRLHYIYMILYLCHLRTCVYRDERTVFQVASVSLDKPLDSFYDSKSWYSSWSNALALYISFVCERQSFRVTLDLTSSICLLSSKIFSHFFVYREVLLHRDSFSFLHSERLRVFKFIFHPRITMPWGCGCGPSWDLNCGHRASKLDVL